ncbi:unnamed protein product, partial [Effrenium voratum]
MLLLLACLPLAAAFGNDWPLRQVCSDLGQIKWATLARKLWRQVNVTDFGHPLAMREAKAMAMLTSKTMGSFGAGHRLEEVCWIGVLALQFWELVMKFPLLYPSQLQEEWRLLISADWPLVLLADFPIWGLLRQAQATVTSCEAFLPPSEHSSCPLPRCDLLEAEDVQDQQHFLDALVNTALAGEAVYMMTSPTVPSCPLGLAAKHLALAVVQVSHGSSSWALVEAAVREAQNLVARYLEEGIHKAPQRDQRRAGRMDPLGELLSSRWDVVGLLHALQVVLRRSMDRHELLPLPWLISEGALGRNVLEDHSHRGTFVRYLLASLRTEFWGSGHGVENFVRLALRSGRSGNRPRVFIDVGAYCHEHECLSRSLLAEVANGSPGRVRVLALEPNRRNLLRTEAELRKLPRRWRRRLWLLRRAAGNTTGKAGAYGGLAWTQSGEGRVASYADGMVQRVPLRQIESFGFPWVELLKIDTEGTELEVLQGARRLLVARRVGAVVLEYSHFWGASADGPLRALAAEMWTYGYEGFYLGRCLVPISGADMKWWHPLYEICARPEARIYRGIAGWCWFNVGFVLRGSPLHRHVWARAPWRGTCSDRKKARAKGKKRAAGREPWYPERMFRCVVQGLRQSILWDEEQADSVGFQNVENPRLRQPPPRLRQRLAARERQEDGLGQPKGESGARAEAEALPGGVKSVPLERLLALDRGDA